MLHMTNREELQGPSKTEVRYLLRLAEQAPPLERGFRATPQGKFYENAHRLVPALARHYLESSTAEDPPVQVQADKGAVRWTVASMAVV